VLLHLNLFSRKPTHLGGSRAQDIDLLSRYKNNVLFSENISFCTTYISSIYLQQ
jgi:hypothetical protein